MYEWIEKVNELVQSLTNEINDIELRKTMAENTIEILNKAGVESFVDCSSGVNSSEVVSNGSFRLLVKTEEVEILFKYIRRSK